MNNPSPELKQAADTIVAEIRRLMVDRDTPILVALDGGSGSGKSTLALLIAEELDTALIQGDDFFAAEISDAEWDTRTPAARATDGIDWRRLRAEALEPLLAGKPAKWHAFDFEAGVRPDGTYAMRTDFVERIPNAVIKPVARRTWRAASIGGGSIIAAKRLFSLLARGDMQCRKLTFAFQPYWMRLRDSIRSFR